MFSKQFHSWHVALLPHQRHSVCFRLCVTRPLLRAVLHTQDIAWLGNKSQSKSKANKGETPRTAGAVAISWACPFVGRTKDTDAGHLELREHVLKRRARKGRLAYDMADPALRGRLTQTFLSAVLPPTLASAYGGIVNGLLLFGPACVAVAPLRMKTPASFAKGDSVPRLLRHSVGLLVGELELLGMPDTGRVEPPPQAVA